MNIFKVIGWTDDSDEKYPPIDGSVAAYQAVITELREKGYRFGGDAHQERRGCCPVLNNGAKVCYSMRGWGAIMAEALGINTDKYAYMEWYMDGWTRVGIIEYEGIERKSIYPHPGVDETRISPALCGKALHSTSLDKARFEGLERGDVTVCCNLRSSFLREMGQIIALHRFNNVQELFASKLFIKTGYSSAEEAAKCLYRNDNEEKERYGILGIEVKLLTE